MSNLAKIMSQEEYEDIQKKKQEVIFDYQNLKKKQQERIVIDQENTPAHIPMMAALGSNSSPEESKEGNAITTVYGTN